MAAYSLGAYAALLDFLDPVLDENGVSEKTVSSRGSDGWGLSDVVQYPACFCSSIFRDVRQSVCRNDGRNPSNFREDAAAGQNINVKEGDGDFNCFDINGWGPFSYP